MRRMQRWKVFYFLFGRMVLKPKFERAIKIAKQPEILFK